jgi:hypothetical protein
MTVRDNVDGRLVNDRRCVLVWNLEVLTESNRHIYSVGAAVESSRESAAANSDRLMQAIALQAEAIGSGDQPKQISLNLK